MRFFLEEPIDDLKNRFFFFFIELIDERDLLHYGFIIGVYIPEQLSASTSWTRENNKNDFKYNAGNAGSEINVASGWYDFPFRNYDATLGRFMQVDPLAVLDNSTSPFAYGANNPVIFNDPMGLQAMSEWLPGVSATAYNRYNSINNRNDPGYFDSWYESFSNYAATDHDGLARFIAGVTGVAGGFSGSVQFAKEHEGLSYDISVSFVDGVAEGIAAFESSMVASGQGVAEGGAWSISGQGGFLGDDLQGGQGKGNGGFDWFFGAEGAATLGWENFALEVKNVGGFDYKRDARDWRVTSSSKYGGNGAASPNKATIDRTSFSAGFGATIQKNKDIVNGVPVFTESYTVGWEALGIQVNFDSMQNVTDIRFGVDTGVSIAIFGGLEISFQAGGIYVFK